MSSPYLLNIIEVFHCSGKKYVHSNVKFKQIDRFFFQLQKELRQIQSWEQILDLLQSKIPENVVYGEPNSRIVMNYFLQLKPQFWKQKKLIFPAPIEMHLEKVSKLILENCEKLSQNLISNCGVFSEFRLSSSRIFHRRKSFHHYRQWKNSWYSELYI